MSKSLQISFLCSSLTFRDSKSTFSHTVQSLSPSPNSRREQLTKNCWDCQVHLLSVNPVKLKRCKEKPAKHFSNVQLLLLAPICATSGPISSFCSFLCYIQADYIISKEAGSLSSVTIFFSIFTVPLQKCYAFNHDMQNHF